MTPTHLMQTYPPPRATFVRGSGTMLVDAAGNEWCDFLCGIGVTNLGHSHPAVTAAVTAQASTLVHVSNLFQTDPAVALAADLARITGWDDAKVFFAQCGATANEAAIKLARRHGKQQSDDKYRLVTLEGGFHGRTMATLEATGQPAKHAPFAPLAGFVDMVPHDDPVAVAEAVTDETCAVLVEVIQGEGGVRRVPDEVLVAARNACDEHNALLMIDEVQTGMGRTGNWFAFQQTAVVPDVITLAKALGNGLPIGACVARGGAADVLRPGDHATTFGGNPVTCAAARAVIATIEAEDLLPTARERSEQLQTGLLALVDQHDVAVGVRGQGLLVGLEVAGPHAAALEQACSNRRLITNAVATNVLRIAPPLTVSETEIAHALEVVDAALGDIAGRFQEQE